MKAHISRQPPTPPLQPSQAKRRFRLPTVFRTISARIGFVITAAFAGVAGVAAFAAFRLREAYRPALPAADSLIMEADRLALESLAVASIAGVSVFLLALALGDILISRRARKLARSMLQVIAGEADPSVLPRGLGELDGVTEIYDQCIREVDRVKSATAAEVRLKLAETELGREMTELQMARLEALLSSLGEAVVATDRDGAISFLNGVAKEALWFHGSSPSGVPIARAFQMEDEKGRILSPEEWPIWETLKSGRKVVTPAPVKPFYLRNSRDFAFPVRITFTPVTIGGETAGAIAVFADITDEVEIDRQKSEFISVASHQLRSPSSAIRMMTDMMRKGDFGRLTDQQQAWIDKLFMASDSMTELISELLNVSRLEAGTKMDREMQDSGAAFDDLIAKSEMLLIEKSQKFDYRRDELPAAEFDRFMIGETVKNLISNAAKYSPVGAMVTVRIEADGPGLRFSVRDQGMGIPEPERKKMFGKFFRASNAAKSETKGTGLGLYYCKTAVEKHGGDIGFESEEGKGSTFWFTLPAAKPAAPKKNGD